MPHLLSNHSPRPKITTTIFREVTIISKWLPFLLIGALMYFGYQSFLRRPNLSNRPPPEARIKAPKVPESVPTVAPAATATPLPQSNALRATAETRYLPSMTPALSELIKAQPWYKELNPARMAIVIQAQKTEKAAQPRGEVRSVAAMLQFATEQSWYQDGLDDKEAAELTGVLEAYGRSLADNNAPAIGPLLSTTLKQASFDVVNLPESGPIVVLISSDKADLAKKTLDLSEEGLPRIEKVTGKFPYHFLHFQVTPNLPSVILGASYNEFIFIRSDSVDAETVDHEMTHSTLYGDFPLWFEEGFAHFLQYYLSDALNQGQVDYRTLLSRASVDPRLDIRPTRGDSDRQELIDRARGFLFVKALYDIRGIEGISALVRTLRTHSYTDQDLVRAIASDGTQEQQDKVANLLCKMVVGTVRSYCVPAR